MNDLTVKQLEEMREALERDAATRLGQMLFEFSRLDVNLGLCVVWVEDGRRLDELTKQVQEFGFHKKLDFLSEFIEKNLPKGSKRHAGYTEWIARAHTARRKRNELVHGRWGVDAAGGHVINVIGLPTSPDQREVRYSLAELDTLLGELKQLQADLGRIRFRWSL